MTLAICRPENILKMSFRGDFLIPGFIVHPERLVVIDQLEAKVKRARIDSYGFDFV